jgi:beta-lactamase regulating signal transducer with metallopeptidase domain
MIAFVNSAAARWLACVAAASLDSALLLALLGLVWFAIRGRVAPQVGYCLFLLVPLKLLMPVVVTVPASLARWTPSALISSGFQAAYVPARIERQPLVAKPIAPAGTDRPAPSGPVFEPHPHSRPLVAVSVPPVAPAASALAHPVAAAPRLSVPAVVMILWLAGILFLLGRLAAAQRRFRARLQHVIPLDELRLAIDFPELCRRAGAPETIRIVESDGIAAPSVWGIVRPTILLPQGIAASLTAEQLRWVLLHELAHVQRHDLLVVALQRFAAILHFFNPAIWIANRIIHQLREYACDDLAASLSHSSAVEAGEAFLRILRHADESRRGLEGALGVFGLDSRAGCLRRVRRLLDTDRPIRTAPRARWIWPLILLAVVSVPHLRAASEAPRADSQEPARESVTRNQADPKAASDKAVAPDGQEFELRVVGPGGQPIPKADVELRTDPHPTAKQIRQGTFVRQGSYGSIVATDAEGRLVVELPRAPERFNVFITIPGYGPYWAGWSSETHAQPIPARFTAELEAAWSVGGIFIDGAGKVVEGVKIRPGIEFKKPPGDARQMGSGARVQTDAAGKWRFDSVPVSMSEVYVEINHPDYTPVRRSLARGEFGLERGQEPVARIVLDRGLTVTGKVTDEAGNPIVGALLRTKFHNDIRAAKTGPDGTYRMTGCEAQPVRLVISAPGKATDMKELNIDPGMGPVDFQMKPGGTVRVRVLDQQGNPVPKARIFLQRWRGPVAYFEFNHVNDYADEKGVWVWHEAPLDEFQADICPPDGMQLLVQPLIAREEEYVFRTASTLNVSGRVIDAVTRKPIEQFRVVPGVWYNKDMLGWHRHEGFVAREGHYEIRRDRGDFAHRIRIEADGYQTAVSRDIKSTEGTITIDFELKRGNDLAATVMAPGNVVPASGARVALGVAGAQINIKNGDIDDISTFCARVETDASGRFHFPAPDKDFQLVIVHPSGFAHISSTPEWDSTRTIALEPWSRVEGTFRIGKTPAANVPITLYVARLHSYGKDLTSISTDHEATTGPDGRFFFERVIPGIGSIGRCIILTLDQGSSMWTTSGRIAAEFPAGKTVHLDLGGTGRPVIGRLRPPEGFPGRVRWNLALVTATADAPEPRTESSDFKAGVDGDGRFRIDDVPAGSYSLRVEFERGEAAGLQNLRFKVPPPEGEVAAQPVDLGMLRLDSR